MGKLWIYVLSSICSFDNIYIIHENFIYYRGSTISWNRENVLNQINIFDYFYYNLKNILQMFFMNVGGRIWETVSFSAIYATSITKKIMVQKPRIWRIGVGKIEPWSRYSIRTGQIHRIQKFTIFQIGRMNNDGKLIWPNSFCVLKNKSQKLNRSKLSFNGHSL